MNLSVCQFGTYPPPVTGISVHIQSLVVRLRQAGVGVRVINTTATGGGGAVRRRVRSLLHYALALVKGMAARESVVHAHGSSGLTFWSRLPLLLVLRLRGKATLYTNHSGDFPDWAEGQRLTRPLLRFAVRLPSRIIALNERQRQAYLSLGCHPDRLSLISPFVGFCGEIGPLPAQLTSFAAHHSPLICVSGGWRRLYGLESFVAAFSELRRNPEFSAAGAVALMSFSAHDELAYQEEVQAQLLKLGLGDHLLVLPGGQTPHPEAMALILASDAFVRPSLHDGDSVSVREALALARPTIATDTGLRPVGCLLYPPGDSRALAELLDRVLREPRSPAPPISAEDDNLARMLEVYRQVTGEHPSSGSNARQAP